MCWAKSFLLRSVSSVFVDRYVVTGHRYITAVLATRIPALNILCVCGKTVQTLALKIGSKKKKKLDLHESRNEFVNYLQSFAQINCNAFFFFLKFQLFYTFEFNKNKFCCPVCCACYKIAQFCHSMRSVRPAWSLML